MQLEDIINKFAKNDSTNKVMFNYFYPFILVETEKIIINQNGKFF